MSAREVDHGPTVLNGVLRRTSVSALQLADDSTNEGCLRKWWHSYVRGVKEPSTQAQARGTRCHAETENYLRTGEKRLSDQIIRNLHMIPTPGPDLSLEYPTIPVMPDGGSGLHLAPLRAAGIPVVGYIDVMHSRRTNAGCSDIEDTTDPPNTVEIIDWKFPGSLDFAKRGPDLVKTIQMSGYGMFAFLTVPDLQHVRLSHGYMPVKGRGEKVTARVQRPALEKSWEHAESVARSITDAAREIDPDKVTPNIRACRAYKKLCMFASDGSCTAGNHNSLYSIVNAKPTLPLTHGDLMGLTIGKKTSILDQIQGRGTTATMPVAAMLGLSGVPVADPAKAEADAKAAREAEVARLKAEELELRAARAFEALCTSITDYGSGFPPLAGRAAEMYLANRPGFSTAGEGVLAGLDPVSDPAILAQLAEELSAAELERRAKAEAAPEPVVAELPGHTVIVMPDANPLLSPETPESVIPVSSAEPAPQALPAPAVEPPTETVAEKARRGRKPKAAPEVSAAVPATPPPVTPVPESTDTVTTLLIDVCAEDNQVVSLHGLIDGIREELAVKHNNGVDIRVAPADSALGFGRWTGALATTFATAAAQLPPGTYSIDTRDSQIRAICAEEMARVVRRGGGRIYRGVR